MSFDPLSRQRRGNPAKTVTVPGLVGYGIFAVAFCFTSAVVLGLVP